MKCSAEEGSNNASLYLSLTLSANWVLVLPQVEKLQLQFVTGYPASTHCTATWLSPVSPEATWHRVLSLCLSLG